jgi:hypothetical protein
VISQNKDKAVKFHFYRILTHNTLLACGYTVTVPQAVIHYLVLIPLSVGDEKFSKHVNEPAQYKIARKVLSRFIRYVRANTAEIMKIFSCGVSRRAFWQKIIEISEMPDFSIVTIINTILTFKRSKQLPLTYHITLVKIQKASTFIMKLAEYQMLFIIILP